MTLAIVTVCLQACVNGARRGPQCDDDRDCFAPAVCGPSGLCVEIELRSECASEPCEAPTVATIGAESPEPGTIRLKGRVEADGGAPVGEHGFCWAVDGTPLPGEVGTTCNTLGPLGESGVFAAEIESPDSTAAIRYRAYATNAVATGLGTVFDADFAFVGELTVAAGDGTAVGEVELQWPATDGITLYRVYRDTELIATVAAPPWTDVDAGAGGLPAAPAPTATGTEVFVSVRWPVPESAPGPIRHYEVVAIGAGGAVEGSGDDDGFARGEPPSRYQVSVDGSPFVDVVRPEYIDTDAAPPWVDFELGGTVEIGFGEVTISCDEPVIHEAPERTYVVRAINSRGVSAESAPTTGRRGHGTLYYRFYREDFVGDDRLGMLEIGRNESGTYVDREPLPDGLLAAYFCQSWLPGGDVAYGPVRTAWGALCDTVHACDDGLTCTAGRCAPPGFTAVPPAFFALSTTSGDSLSDSDEATVDNELTGAFVIATTEVTQGQWLEVMGENPSSFSECGLDCPVEQITWWSALAYLNALSDRDGLARCYDFPPACSGSAPAGTLECFGEATVLSATGSVYDCRGYRLPTEAEWVLAARGVAGSHDETGEFGSDGELNCSGPTAPSLDAFAWLCGNSAVDYAGCQPTRGGLVACAGTHPVGQLRPNLFGLYDVIGNVDEFNWDGYALFPDADPYVDYAGPAVQGVSRVAHGGGWYSAPADSRVADRHDEVANARSNVVGFRVARSWP